MIESSDMKLVGGVATYWCGGRYISRAELCDGLEVAGFLDFAPEKRSGPAALRSALAEMFSRTHRVEPLKRKDAFEVVAVFRGEERNTYSHHLWVGIDKELQVEIRPFDPDLAQRIVWEFNKHLGLISRDQLTQTLVKILTHLGATRLPTGSGGLYWLPDTQLAQWSAVARAVEATPCRGGKAVNTVYLLRHALGHEEVKAVRDAIIQEIESETARIHTEVLGGELGAKALEHRQREADGLRQKISLYEGLLQVGLDDLRKDLDLAEEAASAARLMASSMASSQAMQQSASA